MEKVGFSDLRLKKFGMKIINVNITGELIIDGEDNIVERCVKFHPNYTAAFSDAVEKMSVSPLYSRQTSPDMKKKLEEYKAKKALEKKRKTNVIFKSERTE